MRSVVRWAARCLWVRGMITLLVFLWQGQKLAAESEISVKFPEEIEVPEVYSTGDRSDCEGASAQKWWHFFVITRKKKKEKCDIQRFLLLSLVKQSWSTADLEKIKWLHCGLRRLVFRCNVLSLIVLCLLVFGGGYFFWLGKYLKNEYILYFVIYLIIWFLLEDKVIRTSCPNPFRRHWYVYV